MKKASILLIFTVLFVLAAEPALAFAGTDTTTEYLPDKSRFVTTVETSPCGSSPQPTASSSFVSGTADASVSRIRASKKVEYLSRSGKVLWYVKITGFFAYDGNRAVCLRAKASAKAKASRWKIVDKRAWKSKRKVWKNGKAVWKNGNMAYASATGKWYKRKKIVKSVPKQLSLTCSPSGKVH